MILFDVNLLIYAVNQDAPLHRKAKALLEASTRRALVRAGRGKHSPPADFTHPSRRRVPPRNPTAQKCKTVHVHRFEFRIT